MKVSLFATCLMDVFYPETGKDTVELLERLGCEVDFPEAQTCCGQPAFNSGYHTLSKETMKHMMTVFAESTYVVTPSGSCGTMIKEYPTLFKDDPEWYERAILLKEKTYELTDFIVHVLGVEDVGATFHGTATYHTSCHMTRLLKVTEAPKTLLGNVRGLTMKPLKNAQNCCGFGGTFAVKMPPISKEMVDEKVNHVEETEADVLIGADCGCLMNIGGRLQRRNSDVKVLHIASILNSQTGAKE
ncbi:(Fe-S)-binding protein [Aureibacillus halotolerans]|uniref:Lactate utilization protein A n=1 Tax=Aureibacillus halotolerans TaxID=1508390 RepID=A0A4R6U6P6_9BACI|nr:(Fe-S)-binding protein [Aureibacillus halotolerans]TDQ42180.1 L-lactate dehydrogenase complex protein LldE [Aureibacillus halotolerans]